MNGSELQTIAARALAEHDEVTALLAERAASLSGRALALGVGIDPISCASLVSRISRISPERALEIVVATMDPPGTPTYCGAPATFVAVPARRAGAPEPSLEVLEVFVGDEPTRACVGVPAVRATGRTLLDALDAVAPLVAEQLLAVTRHRRLAAANRAAAGAIEVAS